MHWPIAIALILATNQALIIAITLALTLAITMDLTLAITWHILAIAGPNPDYAPSLNLAITLALILGIAGPNPS